MRLTLRFHGTEYTVDLPGLSDRDYEAARAGLQADLARPEGQVKNREAICSAFLALVRSAPTANPSDLWHHVVYRLYCEILPNTRQQNPPQSWVRSSGDALELFLERWYEPILHPHGVSISALIGRAQKRAALAQFGISDAVGDSKLDVTLARLVAQDERALFGGVHVKASLAERVSDDIPCSRALQRKGFLSPLWTLDVKSFPPPHGDLVNRGELGAPDSPSEKRKYVEEHGDFDHCYSANTRSVPSAGKTRSGKRVIVLDLARQPDQFAKDVTAAAARKRC
jgi:hypothetical protein